VEESRAFQSALAYSHRIDVLAEWKTIPPLFQIDFENHVPYAWGDGGIAHFTQCPDRPDVLTVGWTCS
jgi:hypothetical protein